MRRRAFLGGSTAMLVPLAADAGQAAKLYRIGMLDIVPAAQNAANLHAFQQGLRGLGYVEGPELRD